MSYAKVYKIVTDDMRSLVSTVAPDEFVIKYKTLKWNYPKFSGAKIFAFENLEVSEISAIRKELENFEVFRFQLLKLL